MDSEGAPTMRMPRRHRQRRDSARRACSVVLRDDRPGETLPLAAPADGGGRSRRSLGDLEVWGELMALALGAMIGALLTRKLWERPEIWL